jgi:hypothetical protein
MTTQQRLAMAIKTTVYRSFAAVLLLAAGLSTVLPAAAAILIR